MWNLLLEMMLAKLEPFNLVANIIFLSCGFDSDIGLFFNPNIGHSSLESAIPNIGFYVTSFIYQ